MDVQRRTVTANNLEFTVRVGGPENGPALLLLHGFPTAGAVFDDVVPRLHESGLRTIVPDQRGYSEGARPDDVSAYRIEHLASDAVAILDGLSIPYAIVAGHDWGAAVAWHLAATRLDRFTALIAASLGHPVSFARDIAQRREKGERIYFDAYLGNDAASHLLADGGDRFRASVPGPSADPIADPAVLPYALNWYRANLADEDGLSALTSCPPVELPTTVVFGVDDPFIPAEQVRASSQLCLSDYRECAVPDVGHWVPQAAPAALASEIALRSSLW